MKVDGQVESPLYEWVAPSWISVVQLRLKYWLSEADRVLGYHQHTYTKHAFPETQSIRLDLYKNLVDSVRCPRPEFIPFLFGPMFRS